MHSTVYSQMCSCIPTVCYWQLLSPPSDLALARWICRSISDGRWGTLSLHLSFELLCVCLRWPARPEKPWQIFGRDTKQTKSVIKLKRPINHWHFAGRVVDLRPLQLWQVRRGRVPRVYVTPLSLAPQRFFFEIWQIAATLPSLALKMYYCKTNEHSFHFTTSPNSKTSLKNTGYKNDRSAPKYFSAVPAARNTWNAEDDVRKRM